MKLSEVQVFKLPEDDTVAETCRSELYTNRKFCDQLVV